MFLLLSTCMKSKESVQRTKDFNIKSRSVPGFGFELVKDKITYRVRYDGVRFFGTNLFYTPSDFILIFLAQNMCL